MHGENGKQSFTSIRDVIAVTTEDASVTFKCENALLRLTILDANTIRIRTTFTSAFKPDVSFVVLPSTRASPEFKVMEETDGWRVITSALQVHISKSPCRLAFYDSQGNIINADTTSTGMSGNNGQVRCSKVLPAKEHYYGFGHKGIPLDKRSVLMTMWNQHQLYEPESDPLSVNVPFFTGICQGNAYGLFFDTPAKSVFDMGASDSNSYTIILDDTELNYYFIFGPDPKQVLHRYSMLTGTIPLPPKWTLGYHQCRYSYPNEKRIREIATELRSRRIPCDAIWFDIHYLDNFRFFTWDKKAFPNPKKLISDLSKADFHSVVIIDPGVVQDENYKVYKEGLAKDAFLRKEDGEFFLGTIWGGPAVFPDFLQSKVRSWWGDLHIPFIEQGVAAIWNDLNEPQVFIDREYKEMVKVVHSDGRQSYPHTYIHNLYANLMDQATFEALQRLRPNTRPWILSRSGWAGVQRFAAIWTADNGSTWEHLRATVPMLLNLSMAGIPFVGADVGGFSGDSTPELFTRWLQMAVFTPFCRNHTCLGTADQEPWAFGTEVEEISRHYISWRYQLLPYFYDLAYEASITGIPIIRPLVLEFPGDEHCHSVDDEFLLGPSLLVAPILAKGANEREIYLPPANWMDMHTQKQYTGPTTIKIPAPLNHCPTFIRLSSIIPLQPVVQHSEEPIHQLNLYIYLNSTQEGAMEYRHYEDDGNSLAYKKNKFSITQYWCYIEPGKICFDILAPEGTYDTGKRTISLIFRTLPKPPKKILLDGHELAKTNDIDGKNQSEEEWFWNDHDKVLHVNVFDRHARMEVIVFL
ncbi:MAG: glycoside hydrolase family 31 protein [Promethearchaeota archaeon]